MQWLLTHIYAALFMIWLMSPDIAWAFHPNSITSIIPASDRNVWRGCGGLHRQLASLSLLFPRFISLSLFLQINDHIFSASDQNVCRGCGGLHRQLASLSPFFPCFISLSSGLKQIKKRNGNVKRLDQVNSANLLFEFWSLFFSVLISYREEGKLMVTLTNRPTTDQPTWRI